MNAHYTIHYFDDLENKTAEAKGIVVGTDEADVINKLKDYYDPVTKYEIWFDENFDCDVIPEEYFNTKESDCV